MTRNQIAFALAAVLFCVPVHASENQITQSSFDEGIVGWDDLDEDKTWEQFDDAEPGNPNPGSLEILARNADGNAVRLCLGIVGGEYYAFNHHVKLILEGSATGRAGMSVIWYTGEVCTNTLEGPYIHPFSLTYDTQGEWKESKIVGGPPLQVRSAMIILGVQKFSGSDEEEVRARFDDVFAGFLYDDTTTTTTTLNETTTTTDDTTTTTADVPNAPGCGDPVLPYDTFTTSDALYVLRGSVGAVLCDNCLCDTDNSGIQTTSDALRTLRLAVGYQVLKDCGGGCVYQQP